MSRFRRRADDNQRKIVTALRAIPGVTVVTGHDDILVGHQGRTYWFELKSRRAVKADGTPREFKAGSDGRTRAKQLALQMGWRGHYQIVSTAEEIMEEIGIPLDFVKNL